MSILETLEIPDPKLRKKAQFVEKVDDTVRKLMDDLKETCESHDAFGLASIQVGDTKSVIFVDGRNYNDTFYQMANPEITWHSSKKIDSKEGCLSIPGGYYTVKRYAEVEVSYLDYNNEIRKKVFKGDLARCVQHEIDHLKGILYIDYLSPLKSKMLIKKYKKFSLERSRSLEN